LGGDIGKLAVATVEQAIDAGIVGRAAGKCVEGPVLLDYDDNVLDALLSAIFLAISLSRVLTWICGREGKPQGRGGEKRNDGWENHLSGELGKKVASIFHLNVGSWVCQRSVVGTLSPQISHIPPDRIHPYTVKGLVRGQHQQEGEGP
jgi:hypothetical protein